MESFVNLIKNDDFSMYGSPHLNFNIKCDNKTSDQIEYFSEDIL